MTAEQVFHAYRKYKFFYKGFDWQKYSGDIKHPPLIKQFDRSYYYRMAQKLGDAQIHGVFMVGFFFNPNAHISELVTPALQQAGLLFAGRHENGDTLMQHDLFELAKRVTPATVDEWLYGALNDDGSRDMMPVCLSEVIAKELPIDIACTVLLVSQPHLQYHWVQHFAAQPNFGLGPHLWIDRLSKIDQLIRLHRPTWRRSMQTLAREFWDSRGVTSLAPYQPHSNTESSLF